MFPTTSLPATSNEEPASISICESTAEMSRVTFLMSPAATDADKSASNPTSAHEAVANVWLPATKEPVN